MAEPYDHRAGAGVADPELAALLEDHWEAAMRRHPVWASRIGDRRYDDRLPGTRPEDHAEARAETAAFIESARAIDPAGLEPADRLTHRLFLEQLEMEQTVAEFRMEEWQLLARFHPLIFVNWLPELRPLASRGDAESLIARYRAMPEYVDGEIETLALGVAGERFANRESVRRIVEMIRQELEKPAPEWPAVSQLTFTVGAHDAGAEEALREGAAAAVEDHVRPAIERYVAFLEEEILPRARTGTEVGIVSLSDGAAAYEALIRKHTSLALTAEEIHETGLSELAKIRAEFAEIGERVFGTRDVPEIFDRLRSDPDLRFETAEQVREKAEAALAAAEAAAPDWFGRLPLAPCVVKPVPEHEAPYTTIAYYRPPPADGSGPGEYRVNVYAPETRPRHEAEVLAFHEAVPGHHTQIAIAQELPEMPAFRRHGGMTAYVEGWALYIERLADEMGLYSGDTYRLGMLSFDAWRAARLVVDTGIHTMGWDRGRAVAFMKENTPLARNNIDNEVDRYVSWPGQALSYKLGQIEMWRLRRLAEETLAEAFDVKGFHDCVLGAGALPLGALADHVRAWIEAQSASAS